MGDENRSVVGCVIADAWKGFKGWWIPLCLLSFILLMTQSWIPAKVISTFSEVEVFEPVKSGLTRLVEESAHNGGAIDQVKVEKFVYSTIAHFGDPVVITQIQSLVGKVMLLLMILVIFVSVVHITLIVASRAALRDKAERNGFCRKEVKRTPQLFFSYLFLTFVKIIPFFFFVVPGVYVYIKLYFTGMLITEESSNPLDAMAKSWEMSEGHFFDILLVFLITIVIDTISLVTLIGFIPGTSVKYTLRSSLYELVKSEKQFMMH